MFFANSLISSLAAQAFKVYGACAKRLFIPFSFANSLNFLTSSSFIGLAAPPLGFLVKNCIVFASMLAACFHISKNPFEIGK